MKPIGILSLSLLLGLAAENATAQEVASLVRIDPANRSASPAVTRSIAEYIAARNNATVVQVMARSQPDRAPAMTVEQAMNLHKLHRASQQGGKPQRYGWRRREPDIEEVRAEILRKVAALEKARGLKGRGIA